MHLWISGSAATFVACSLSGSTIISRGEKSYRNIFDDLKLVFWIKPLFRSCMCVLFISNMFFFLSCQCCLWFVLSRLFSTPSRVVLVNCGWVSKDKCTFVWLFLYEWHATNKGWCDFVVFFIVWMGVIIKWVVQWLSGHVSLFIFAEFLFFFF